MSTNKTEYYHLNQWGPEDQVLREEFNTDNARIDAAIAARGNCRIVTGSYVGAGVWGADNPCRLTFDFKPLVIFLDTRVCESYNSIPEHYILFQGASEFLSYRSTSVNVLTWSGNQVSWYYNDAMDSDGPERQFNKSGQTYHYIAIG